MDKEKRKEEKEWRKKYYMAGVLSAVWIVGAVASLWFVGLDIKYSYFPALLVMDWMLALALAIATTPFEMALAYMVGRKDVWARTDKLTKVFFQYIVTPMIIWDIGSNCAGIILDGLDKGADRGWAYLTGALGLPLGFAEVPLMLFIGLAITTLSDQGIAREELVRLGVMGNEEKVFGGGWDD